MRLSAIPYRLQKSAHEVLCLVVLLIVVLSSCQRDESLVFTALTQQYNGAKEYLSGDDIYWSDGDEVNINGTTFPIVVDAGNHHSATVSADGISAINGMYYAAYPGAISAVGGSTITFTLPQGENYSLENGNQHLNNIMAAATSSTEFTFENLCALLHFSLSSTSADARLCALEVCCDKPICGTFQATHNGSTWTVTPPTNAADTLRRLTFSEPYTLSGSATDFYLLVPPVSGVSKFTLRYIVEDANGTVKSFEMKKSGSIAFAKGVRYDFPVDNYNGTNISNGTVTATNSMDGSAAHPYELYSNKGWKAMMKVGSDSTSKHFALQNDITIDTTFANFKATLDGKGHTIKLNNPNKSIFKTITGGAVQNLTIDADAAADSPTFYDNSKKYFGFLSCSTYTSAIINCINKASISYNSDNATIGGICGRASTASFINCRNEGNIEGCGAYIGGISGRMESCTAFSNNTNNGNITVSGDASSTTYCGGIAGYLSMSPETYTISRCFNSGTITISVSSITYQSRFGGLFGQVKANLDGCGNIGTITNNTTLDNNIYIGGLIGCDSYSASTLFSIRNCYNEGAVTSTTSNLHMYVGGIIGWLQKTNIYNCYAFCNIIGYSVGGLVGIDYNNLIISCTLSNCYYYGTISADNNAYGLSGVDSSPKHVIDHCYCPSGLTMFPNSCTNNGGNGTLQSGTELTGGGSLVNALNGNKGATDSSWVASGGHVVLDL